MERVRFLRIAVLAIRGTQVDPDAAKGRNSSLREFGRRSQQSGSQIDEILSRASRREAAQVCPAT